MYLHHCCSVALMNEIQKNSKSVKISLRVSGAYFGIPIHFCASNLFAQGLPKIFKCGIININAHQAYSTAYSYSYSYLFLFPLRQDESIEINPSSTVKLRLSAIVHCLVILPCLFNARDNEDSRSCPAKNTKHGHIHKPRCGDRNRRAEL